MKSYINKNIIGDVFATFLEGVAPILFALAVMIVFAVFDFFKCYAAAPVPMERLLRNGLTDAQVTQILSTDPDAVIHLTGSTWRNVEFNTHRYNNVTNWLAVIGETNDFARLVVPVTATNEILTAENEALRTENARLERQRDLYYTAYTNATAQVEALTVQVTNLQARVSLLDQKIYDEVAWLTYMKLECDRLAEKYPAQREEIMAIKAQFQARIEYLEGQAELGHQDGGAAGDGEAEVDGEEEVDGEMEVDVEREGD